MKNSLSSSTPTHPGRLKSLLAGIFLLALSFCAYSNTLSHPFVHDDVIFIVNNPSIGDLDPRSVFLRPDSAHLPGVNINAYYRPLLEWFTRIEHHFFGQSPTGYHVVNIILHAVNGLLIYLIMTRLFSGSARIPLAVAVLFVAHPVQSESVACISGASNLLYACLSLLSFYVYMRAGEDQTHRRFLLFYVLSLVFFLLGMFVKVQAVIVPGLILVYEWLFGRIRTKMNLVKMSGYFCVLAGYFWIRKTVVGNALPSVFDTTHELSLRLMAIPKTLLMYMQLIVFPHGLHYYRTIDVLQPAGVHFVILVIIILGMIWVIRKSGSKRKPLLMFGAAWFLIGLIPVLNIIPLIVEYSHILTSEHFLYLPLAGALMFLLILINRLMKEDRRKLRVWILAAITVLCVLLTVRQNRYWRNDVVLFERVTEYEGQLGRVHILLGQAYYFNRQYERSIKEYKKALNIIKGYKDKVKDPGALRFYVGMLKGIHFDLAHAYLSAGDLVSSTREFSLALELDPRDGMLHNSLGVNYIQLKDFEHAAFHLRTSLILNPGNIMAMNNLAICYINLGRIEEARDLFQKILQLDPSAQAARMNLERLLSQERQESRGKN